MIRRFVIVAMAFGAVAGVGGFFRPSRLQAARMQSAPRPTRMVATTVPKGDPDYALKLDRDGDGIACES
jgi:hypothetical protein